MVTNAERVRLFRERKRAANPKEPNWKDVTGRLNVVSDWLKLGHTTPESFISMVRGIAGQLGLSLPQEPDQTSIMQAVSDALAHMGYGDVVTSDNLVSILQKIADDRQQANEYRQQAQVERDAAVQYRLGVDSHMTQEEYRLVLGCLHPDRQPEDKRDRYNKAFEIFKRLEKTVNPKKPISVLRERGWENVSPYANKNRKKKGL